jgi:hypothetical protein
MVVAHQNGLIKVRYALLTQPTLLRDSVEILAEILHPDIFDYGYKNNGWQVL